MFNLKKALGLFGKRPTHPQIAALRPEKNLCVIGDIHGRLDLLEDLLSRIEVGGTEHDGIEKLVFLGDYIDRGEASMQVLQLLHDLSLEQPGRIHCLMGNHERMLLNFLDTPAKSGRSWLRNGGLQTCASAGIGQISDTSSAEKLASARNALRKMLPHEIERWLRSLPLTYQTGNLCAVHAALDPTQPLSKQSESTMLWGCRQFRQVSREDGLWVIHGHTIVEQPTVENAIISIDTGAYATNQLSAAMINTSGEIRFMQSRKNITCHR